MTGAEIAEALPRITYKPGWMIRCHQQPYDSFPYEGFCLDITFDVPNAYRTQDTQTQNVHVPLPPIVNEEHLVDFIAWRLARIEMHEMREFLWLDGKIRDDPHAPELRLV